MKHSVPRVGELAPLLVRGLLLPGLLLLGACGSGGSDGEPHGEDAAPGTLLPLPDGSGLFFVDAHQGGESSRLRLAETSWGRLVDVHDVDPQGIPSAVPLLRDFVIAEHVRSDPTRYLLETNPLTQVTRLVVLRTHGAPDAGGGTFEDLLREATRDMAPVQPKNDDGSAPEPFSFVARNAVLVLRFDDLLEDGEPAAEQLASTVQVRTGYPPVAPMGLRVVFDRHHGGILRGRFRSTRVLVDTTVSRVEAASMQRPLQENLLGLPASLTTTGQPNASLRIPTRPDPSSGLFEVLRSAGGAPLSETENGPLALGAPTRDVVRAMRAGNELDLSRGFLSDRDAPTIVGAWPITLDAAHHDPAGTPGVDLFVDLSFATPCGRAPRPGDLLEAGSRFLEVRRDGAPPAAGSGKVHALAVRVADALPLSNPTTLLGAASYSTAFDPTLPVATACWIGVQPTPASFPALSVDPSASFFVRFSEPMDPGTLGAFGSFQLVQGRAPVAPSATNTVVARVASSGDLRQHVLEPLLPLDHRQGSTEPYTLLLAGGPTGPSDLGGNPLVEALPPVELFLDPLAPSESTGGLVLRFESPNEVQLGDPSPGGNDDLRGQILYDLARGRLRPRPVARSSWVVDQSQPVPSLMTPFPVPVDALLSPMGSKLQTLWRYTDVGWLVTDESKTNLDVEGLSWAPFSAAVMADFFEGFEIRLAHSSRLPDEYTDAVGVLQYPASGLLDAPSRFEDNVLADPLSPQTVVHPRSLGYRIDPADAFVASSGTVLQPFPQNRAGGQHRSFTWRDTAVLATGGASGGGIPLLVEEVFNLYPDDPTGSIAGPGQVPSIGLPLLLEFRCYPSLTALGTNRFTVAIARTTQIHPTFRVHSTGGFDTQARRVDLDPDLQTVPSGGFNPSSNPPGLRTPSAFPAFYYGQIDTVVRVSRAHTIWLDSGHPTPDYRAAVVEPDPSLQPAGTGIALDFRGAKSFSGTNGSEFDAAGLDAYGDTPRGSVNWSAGSPTWSSSLDAFDGARYVQVRITFLNDVASGHHAELDTLALAFRR